MKFNLNCVRDVLFLLEEKLTISPDLMFCEFDLDEIASYLNQYDITEIANTLIVLDEAGFIMASTSYSSDCINGLFVSRITYNGYQFLESIRPEPVWNKVKNIGTKVGSFSIDVVSQIAAATITALINAQLGL